MPNKEFLIIAHRGESFDAPENTLASINLAWQRDADAVEVDIQLTKDKKIVLIHDKSTLRVSGIFKRIASNNYDELLLVDAGKIKGGKWKKERIPLLDEVIDTVPANKILFIEIKSDDKIIKPLKKLLEQKNINSSHIRFIGFDINTMKLVKSIMPEFDSYWIVESKNYKMQSKLKETIKKCKSAKLDGLDVQERKYLTEETIHTVKIAGLKIYTWTVDDPERAKQLYFDGIQGVTTNRAFWLKTKLTEEKII